jgi:hypothetical protein
MGDPRIDSRLPLSCDEVEELAALYVIDALSDDEAAAVTHHLSTCPEPHPSIAELAPLGPALGVGAEPVDAPPALRGRVLEAIAATPQVPDPLPAASPAPTLQRAPDSPATPGRVPEPPAATRPGLLERLFGGGGSRGWVAAAAIGLVLVLVGAGIATTIQQRDDQSGRLALLADAVRAGASGDANVATLTGSGPAADAAGYAVFPEGEPGFIVVSGLPSVPSDEAFQAWFIADGAPVSAGLLTLTGDGLGTLTDLELLPGTKVVALTVEDRPGVDAPTSDPVVVGEMPAATA